MLRYPLNRRGKSQQFRLLEPCCRYDLRDGRSSFRERAGLVDHKRVDLLHMLKRLGILDENAEPRAPADAYHDRHRRRQAQRAGTGDDKHGDGRSEEHTSELQSLMRISYAVFCLKKKNTQHIKNKQTKYHSKCDNTALHT